jgi:hypothetical protein
LPGFPVTGFAGEYSPPSLALPGIAITPAVMADARAVLEGLGRERRECRKSTRIEQ